MTDTNKIIDSLVKEYKKHHPLKPVSARIEQQYIDFIKDNKISLKLLIEQRCKYLMKKIKRNWEVEMMIIELLGYCFVFILGGLGGYIIHEIQTRFFN